MEWAITGNIRSRPTATGSRGQCPCCKAEVIAKCGAVVAHHWAHRADDCDPWSEPESEWHRAWKRRIAPAECHEIVIGPHRADVQLPSGVVVEVQRSPLSVAEMKERQDFYKANATGMVWVFHAEWFGRLELDNDGVLRAIDDRRHARKDAVRAPYVLADDDAMMVVAYGSREGHVPARFHVEAVHAGGFDTLIDGMWAPYPEHALRRDAEMARIAAREAQMKAMADANRAEWERRRKDQLDREARLAPIMIKWKVGVEAAHAMQQLNELAQARMDGKWNAMSRRSREWFSDFFESVVDQLKTRGTITAKQSERIATAHGEIVRSQK